MEHVSDRALVGDDSDWITVRGGIRFVFAAALAGKPARYPAPPWLCWFMLSTLRFHEREKWLLELLREFETERADDLRQPIDTLPGWELHGSKYDVRAECVATGERIQLSYESRAVGSGRLTRFSSGEAAFAWWIESLVYGPEEGRSVRRWEASRWPDESVAPELPPELLPEARTWRWLPSGELLIELGSMMLDLGLVRRSAWSNEPLLASDLEALIPRTIAQDFADPAVAARWASHFGDPEVPGAKCCWTQPEAHDAYREWQQRLLRLPMQRRQSLLPLLARSHDGAELVWACDVLLADAGTWPHDVFQFLVDRPRLPPCRGVSRWLERVVVEKRTASDAALAIQYLVARDLEPVLRRERFVAFASAVLLDRDDRSGWTLSKYIELALTGFAEEALQIVRLALRWHAFGPVFTAAAALLAIDQPWCAREVAAAYAERPPHAEVLMHALLFLRHAPKEFPRGVGRSEMTERATEYQGKFQQFPPDFGGGR